MSVFSWVNETFRANKVGNDDCQIIYNAILDSLTSEQLETWIKECDIAESLDYKYGLTNVTPEMYEEAFAKAGLD